mmetsp:Transcript_27721/g.59207  ORF Transcript_27721/g.59207 Transcript_27721/m.59207 type:complete len:169 (+) Transcript_27721:211-717(+)|eukprot:CAMPEP_0172310568 /NCGR_PEP_ID=MMETSP1058-20130122/11740_1 /TAXON_ID=83371 /ORGANISM="Detonula confervacea, Strain CCMP 353" /LENGTH=168 /DNA_ID=CAMNT_0013023403 /DNA_START=120 /DNA_END=626 /DNA_ORIENTATION=-
MNMPTKNIKGSLRRMHKALKLEDETNDKRSKISSTAEMDETKCIPMSIFKQKSSVRQLDLQDLSEKDLISLKMKDPFLYYSIPGVRAARVTLKDVDYSDMNALCHCVSSVSLMSQQPKRQAPATTQVARRSCVSFECHPSLLLEDILDDFSDDEFSLLDGDDLDIFLK